MEIRAVVLEAFKGHKTLAQLSSEFGIHAPMITERSGGPVVHPVHFGLAIIEHGAG